jgi:hypothetical protein
VAGQFQHRVESGRSVGDLLALFATEIRRLRAANPPPVSDNEVTLS